MDNPSLNQNGIEYNGEQIAYKDSTYELVSKVAYLIGVPLRIFQNEREPPKIEIYDRLEQDKNARIIRNLCIIRTAIERNYRKINDIMRMEYRGLLSMPEILPMSSMQQLSNDGKYNGDHGRCLCEGSLCDGCGCFRGYGCRYVAGEFCGFV